MKTKLTLALVALITSSAFAGIPKVLPEFKNAQQLAEWRDEMAAKAESETSTSDVRCSTLDVPSAFYTGKPYIESTGSYAFKYRSYNPELARWTSEDPSGFPDGANGSIYAPTPTNSIDYMGLAKVPYTSGHITSPNASSINCYASGNYEYTLSEDTYSIPSVSGAWGGGGMQGTPSGNSTNNSLVGYTFTFKTADAWAIVDQGVETHTDYTMNWYIFAAYFNFVSKPPGENAHETTGLTEIHRTGKIYAAAKPKE